jgi:hypothetical protein
VTELLYGATIHHKRGWVPFTLTYQHRTVDGGADGNLSEIRDAVNLYGDYALSERSDGRLEYGIDFEELQETRSRRQNVLATNVTHFGDEGRNRLSSRFRFTERTNGGEVYTADGNINYYWLHRENLFTQYSLDGRWSDSNAQTVANVSPSFLLQHRLYDSLTTQFQLFARIKGASFASENEFGGRLSENYFKQLGDWGRLGIGFSPSIAMTSTRPEQETALAENERYRMSSTPPHETLKHPDVLKSPPIVVNHEDCPENVCRENEDYTVEPSDADPTLTELHRTSFSNIGEGDEVLVTYEYALRGKSDILNTFIDVDASLFLFDHVRLFGRYASNRIEVLSGDEDELRLNPSDRVTAGLVLDWPWLTASARYENYDATFGAFDGVTGSLSLTTYGNQAWNLSGNAGYSHRNFTNSGQSVNRMTLAGNASVRLFHRGLLSFELDYLRERWRDTPSTPNDIDEISAGADFTWWYGHFELDLETEMVQFMGRSEDRREYRLDFRVRRSF